MSLFFSTPVSQAGLLFDKWRRSLKARTFVPSLRSQSKHAGANWIFLEVVKILFLQFFVLFSFLIWSFLPTWRQKNFTLFGSHPEKGDIVQWIQIPDGGTGLRVKRKQNEMSSTYVCEIIALHVLLRCIFSSLQDEYSSLVSCIDCLLMDG